MNDKKKSCWCQGVVLILINRFQLDRRELFFSFQIFFNGLGVTFEDFSAHANRFQGFLHRSSDDRCIDRIKKWFNVAGRLLVSELRQAVLEETSLMDFHGLLLELTSTKAMRKLLFSPNRSTKEFQFFCKNFQTISRPMRLDVQPTRPEIESCMRTLSFEQTEKVPWFICFVPIMFDIRLRRRISVCFRWFLDWSIDPSRGAIELFLRSYLLIRVTREENIDGRVVRRGWRYSLLF